MNKEIIKINTDGTGIRTVEARDLHSFIESKQDFSTWMKSRIRQYGFQENHDFSSFHKIVGRESTGATTLIEYHLSIDMAKELAMVERNAKGKEARQYFIECERVARQIVDPMKALNDPAAMRGLLLTYTEKVLALEETVKEQIPKVEALDRISTADGMMCITDAAKTLQIRPMDLFSWLSLNKWIYKRTGSSHWVGYQNRIQQGVLIHKVTTVETSDGRSKTTEQVRVTAKGLTVLANKIGGV